MLAAGKIVVFDRSWYNRSGVDRVFGFCSEEDYWEFLHSCPEFERMLVRSGIILLKYWLSVSADEQETRFQERAQDPLKRWKLSDMDLKSRDLWIDYSKAKDEAFFYTDIPEAPWYTVEADDKRRARLNCIAHALGQIPYKDVIPGKVKLPPRQNLGEYQRPPQSKLHFVDEKY